MQIIRWLKATEIITIIRSMINSCANLVGAASRAFQGNGYRASRNHRYRTCTINMAAKSRRTTGCVSKTRNIELYRWTSRDGRAVPPRRPLRGRVRPHQWRRRPAVAAPPQAAATTAAGASSAAPAATASSGCPATASSAAAAVAAEGSGASASSAAQTAQAGRKVSFWFFNLVYDGYLRITLEHDGLVRRVDHGAAAARLLAVPEDVRQFRRVLFL